MNSKPWSVSVEVLHSFIRKENDVIYSVYSIVIDIEDENSTIEMNLNEQTFTK